MASVQVKPGKLIGYLDDGMYRFLGVPYATAERFQSPKPIASISQRLAAGFDLRPGGSAGPAA